MGKAGWTCAGSRAWSSKFSTTTIFVSFIAVGSVTLALSLCITPSVASASVTSAPIASHQELYSYWNGPRIDQGAAVSIAAGKVRRLTLSDTTERCSWKSDNQKVATVNKRGIVRAIGAGTARITAVDPSTGRAAACSVKVYRRYKQAEIRRSILSLKRKYYSGKPWTNANSFFWHSANRQCFGCAAFAGVVSDKAFGKYAPIRRHASFKRIRIGDHVRIGNRHSTIVLNKRASCIIVAEGNYRASIKWGRVIPKAALKREGFFVETRY